MKNIEGYGVGLYLTRKIIEEQWGSITVKSNENVETEFIILMRKCWLFNDKIIIGILGVV